jgi:hypothetical protein
VWARSTYEILRPFDLPTAEQPMGPFACHATPDHLCHGWVVVSDRRGRENNEYASLALRLWPIANIPPERAPLWGSHTEAADHGQRDCDNPSLEAMNMAHRLVDKYDRLRWGDQP